MQYFAFIAAVLVNVAVLAANPEWDGLRVTWSLNPLNPYGYESVQRDLNSGGRSDFTLRDNQCKIANAKFLGQRYWFKEDPALTVLYDVKGTVAGIQTSLPKAKFSPEAKQINHYYIDDGDYYTITAYFVEPSSICEKGRSKQDLDTQGTGTGLWLQQGPNPLQDSVKIPNTEEEIKKTDWKFGKCFLTMGKHYWYNYTKEMPGSDFIPQFLLYNGGKLTSFGFATNADSNSPHYEHPPTSALKLFLNPMPDFFETDPAYKKLSTMHVFLKDSAKVSSLC